MDDMYDKLIILHTANYSRKIRDFFGVDSLIKKGVDIEFWNCGKITVEEHLSPVHSEGLVLLNIESFSDFDSQIKKRLRNKCLYLSYINYAFYSYKLHRILSSNNVELLYSATGFLPMHAMNIKNENLRSRLKVGEVYKIIRNRYYSRKLQSSKLIPLKYVMESCEIARADYKVSNNTQHIACNSGDYEYYMKVRPYVLENNIPYPVFIDQYIPYHKDLKLLRKRQLSPGEYYNSLNNYFDEFEKMNSCNVIIAAHPSALRYQEDNPYGGRRIEYNKTAELVKGAICVLAQSSTAISFAVLDYKPVILLTSDEIEENFKYMSIHIHSFRDMLACGLVNVDHPTSYVWSEYNRTLYDIYKYKLLTNKQSEDTCNADIIESISKGNYQKFIRE